MDDLLPEFLAETCGLLGRTRLEHVTHAAENVPGCDAAERPGIELVPRFPGKPMPLLPLSNPSC